MGTGIYGYDFNVRRKIFVSYHHDRDQAYYNEFSRLFHDNYEAITDNSLDRLIDSDNSDYVMRRIRERYITGTSCTIVLCGAETPFRKYVDWEISATLEKGHGLIGIKLPTISIVNNSAIVPDRLHDNIDSGYAIWSSWDNLALNPGSLSALIEQANSKSALLLTNTRSRRLRNG